MYEFHHEGKIPCEEIQTMIALDSLKTIFTEKLQETGSLDAALLKTCWVAYKAGVVERKEKDDATVCK